MIYLLVTLNIATYIPELFPTEYRLRGAGVANVGRRRLGRDRAAGEAGAAASASRTRSRPRRNRWRRPSRARVPDRRERSDS